MADEAYAFELVDPKALRILAHPLRMKLLGLLRVKGPQTASHLARMVQESSGVTSYHLRKLAEAGVVEEDRERGTRKERWWRSVHVITHWSVSDFLGDKEAHQASLAFRREIQRFQWRVLEQWLAEESEWDPAWVDARIEGDGALQLTVESAKAMGEEIWAIFEKYRDQPIPEGQDARWVIWFTHGIPVQSLESLL